MQRGFGIIITVLWLFCMVALVRRDVLPFWLAQDPPAQAIPQGRFEIGIFNDVGLRLGTTWLTTNELKQFAVTKVQSVTQLNAGGMLPILSSAGVFYWETDLTYDAGQSLKEFDFRLITAMVAADVTGVRFEREYACKARIGGLTRTMTLDSRLSKYLGDSFRPFTHLEGLHVGQTWRLRIVDPLALLTDQSLDFKTELVRVAARERIEHGGQFIDCFRVQAEGATAWADDSGRVLKQEVKVPLLGRLVLMDEPFDAEARARAIDALAKLRRRNSFGEQGASEHQQP